MFKRIGNLIRMFISFFVEGVEDSVPLERRLAYDRQRRAEKLREGMDAATDIAAYAEEMVRALAEARVVAANVREEIKGHVAAAKAAAARGDLEEEQSEMATAGQLANELAEAQADIAELEGMVNEQLADKAAARQMILDQAKELEKLARRDNRLVSRVRMSEMREQALELKEAMLQVVPGDSSDFRQKAQTQAQRRSDRVKARSELVDALWDQQQRGRARSRSAVSASGAAILAEVASEVGYADSQSATAQPAVQSTSQSTHTQAQSAE